jgi:endonuclease/exonuclease/phosphatase family metal-dependent hydrolase
LLYLVLMLFGELATSCASLPEPASGTRVGISFNVFGKDIQSDNKIDFVFASSDVGVHSHQLVTALQDGNFSSDHYPVLVEVTLD